MNGVNRFERRDWAAAAGLAVLSFMLFVPFRGRLAYWADSAQFVRAIGEFNLPLCEPHAPGYFLYVMLGRLVNLFVGNPHASLVWISVVSGAGLSAVMYLLGAAMFGRRTGVVAALLAMSSPQVWFHSCVALTYVVDSFLVCVTVLCCWRAMRDGGTWAGAALIGALLALVGGVRLQTVPALAPLAGYALWNFRPPRAVKFVVAIATATVVGLVWFVPLVEMSGGIGTYQEIIRRHAALNAPVTLAGGGWESFLWNVALVGVFCFNGLMLGTLVLVGGLLARVLGMSAERRRAWDVEHWPALRMLAMWIVPMVGMATAVAFTAQPGYVLSYLPGLILLVAVVVTSLRSDAVVAVTATVLVAVNAMAFLAWPGGWRSPVPGLPRTAREIREHDRQLALAVETLRNRFDPAQTIVCHPGFGSLRFGLRHFQLYAPQFDHYQVQRNPWLPSPPDRPLVQVRGGKLDFVDHIPVEQGRMIVLVLPPGEPVQLFAGYFDVTQARPVEGTEGMLYVLTARP